MNPIIGWGIGGFMLGAAWESGESIVASPFVSGVIVLGIGLAGMAWYVGRRPSASLMSCMLLAMCATAAFGAGMVRVDYARLAAEDTMINTVLGELVTVEGVVVDEPDVRDRSTRLTVRGERLIMGSGKAYETRATLLATAPIYETYAYGDHVRLSGAITFPTPVIFRDDPSGRAFDYLSFLRARGISYLMAHPEITRISMGEGNAVYAALLTFKDHLLWNIHALLPEPHASLLGGIVLGAKEAMGETLLDNFRTVGVIHIVVLSGYNMVVVAQGIQYLLKPLPRLLALIAASGSIAAFAVMAGAGATVIRASSMAIVALYARASGRTVHALSLLALAGFAMAVVNPYVLLYDPAFQLSFVATAGLIIGTPLIAPYLVRLPIGSALREIVAATVSTQLAVLPLLLYMTGTVSVVALLTNLLILLFIPLTMFLGFCVGFLGLVHPLLALPCAYGAYALLTYDLAIVVFFSSLSFAAITLPPLPLWGVIVWYMAYGAIGLAYASRISFDTKSSTNEFVHIAVRQDAN